MDQYHNQQKQLMLWAIDVFEKANTAKSKEFEEKLARLKNQVNALSQKEFEEVTNMAIAVEGNGKLEVSDKNVKFLLHELIPEMEEIATRTMDENLISAVHQLKGIVGYEESVYPE